MMILRTRKEQYLNEIVGGGDTAPKTPQTREEFFFAEILGEVIAPSPVTRVEKYLSAIAGQYGDDLPTPITRIEYFLARAAGMEIETPIPITREEMLWDTYIPIKTIEGIPPLTFKAKKAGTLKDYRIYGNTAGGESVGDRTGNLFDKSGSQYGNNLHWVPARGLVYSDAYYGSPIMDVTGLNTITRSYTGTSANYFLTSDLSQFVNVSNVGTVDAGVTVNVPDGYTKYVFNIPNTIRPDSIMVNSGSTALPYEPYGYKVPVTVSNGTDTLTTLIYLPEPIKMVGDEAEYVDYKEQKQHRVRKNLLQNTATNLTTYGVTITVNDDGSVTCNGTATSTIIFPIFEKELGQNTYILSGCPENGAQNERYKIQINPGDRWYADIGNGLELEIQNTSTIKVRLVIYPPYTCDNLTFYPMIRLASIADDTYEPYIENTEVDVTLPALPTLSGANTLTVGTEVQPSDVYIKYEGAQ